MVGWTSFAHEAERLRRLWSRDRCRFSTSARFSQIRVPEFTNSAARRFREVAPGDASAASLEKETQGRQGLTPRPYDFRVHPLTPWFTGPEELRWISEPPDERIICRSAFTHPVFSCLADCARHFMPPPPRINARPANNAPVPVRNSENSKSLCAASAIKKIAAPAPVKMPAMYSAFPWHLLVSPPIASGFAR